MRCDTLSPDARQLHERLLALWERTNDDVVRRLVAGEPPVAGASVATAQEQSDWLATGLMTAYQRTGCAEVFALLFELNRASWVRAIKHRLQGRISCVEVEDVLQEAVLNMMRYPHRFRGDHAEGMTRLVLQARETFAGGVVPLAALQDQEERGDEHQTQDLRDQELEQIEPPCAADATCRGHAVPATGCANTVSVTSSEVCGSRGSCQRSEMT